VVDYRDDCPDTLHGDAVDGKGCSETQLSGTGGDGGKESSTPGFGLFIGITAILGASFIATRRR